MQNYLNIPEELKALPHWVIHRKKVPYTPGTGKPAKSNDPTTWRTFDEAAADQSADGIGFMFSGSGYVGVDIDHCIDENGAYNEQARAAIDTLQSYTEISTSGTGIHIICKGNVPGDRNRNTKLGMEIYDSGRYFVMTGRVVEPYQTIRDCQDEINQLYAAYYAPPKPETAPKKTDLNPAASDEDALSVIERAKGPTGEKVRALLRGDTTGYTSPSEADQALCNYLAFYCRKDAAEMDRIFRSSGLMRPKWDEKHGPKTYGAMTIAKAIAGTHNVYDPEVYRVKKVLAALERADVGEEMANKLLFLPYTEAGHADRMKLLYEGKILYCSGSRFPWHAFTGVRWKPIERLYRACVAMGRITSLALEKYGQPDPMDKEAIKIYQSKMANLKSCENTAKIKSIMEQFAERVMVEADRLDADPMLLNVQNGTLDLKTGTLLPHDKHNLITKLCQCDYLPPRSDSLWDRTIKACVPDDEARRWLQKWFGYCLTGSVKEAKFVLLYGQGGTGKSTVLETIGRMLGDYAEVVNIDIFLSGGFSDGEAASPEIAKLPGVRQVRTGESQLGKHFNAAKLKWFTGGDLIQARQLRRPSFTFAPQFKIVMASNYAPALADVNDEGLKRRFVIFPFNVQFKGKDKDLDLTEKLQSKDNLPDVLAWCVEGCRLWQREGLGELPQALTRALGEYYSDNDLVQQFIEECCVIDPTARIGVAYLYQHFLNYYALNGYRRSPMKRKFFSQVMELKGFYRREYKTGFNFMGIALKMTNVFE